MHYTGLQRKKENIQWVPIFYITWYMLVFSSLIFKCVSIKAGEKCDQLFVLFNARKFTVFSLYIKLQIKIL